MFFISFISRLTVSLKAFFYDNGHIAQPMPLLFANFFFGYTFLSKQL